MYPGDPLTRSASCHRHFENFEYLNKSDSFIGIVKNVVENVVENAARKAVKYLKSLAEGDKS